MQDVVATGYDTEGDPRTLVTDGQNITPLPRPYTDADLARLKKDFANARESTLSARRLSRIACDYYDDRQWTSDEIQVLNKRKQPLVWTNKIKPAVNGLLGVLEQGEGDPRAFPRNQPDEEASEVATDLLRYAAEKARWKRTKLRAAADYLKAGTAAIIVEVDEDMDPSPRRIGWEEFFYDPHSKEHDFSDARYMGIAKWMFADQVQSTFGLAEAISVRDLCSRSELRGMDEEDEDKPTTSWGDTQRNRVLVVEMYRNEGGWKRVVFHGGSVLQADVSPYNDDRGRPCCPIVAQACYVDRENQRYGVVRSWVPIQDAINMRESKLLHLVNSRQVRQTADNPAEVSIAMVKKQAALPDGVIPYGYDIVSTQDMSAGQAQLLAISKAEMERAGPTPDVLGRQSASSSGRAQLVRQQAGLTELMPALGGLEDLELRVYRQMWCRNKQYTTDQKVIRVTDDIGAPKFLTVNEPVVEGMKPVFDPQTGMPVVDPRTGQIVMEPNVVGAKNRPSEMDMDIIIDSTPDTVTIQQEQFSALMELAKMYGPQEVTFDDALELSSIPRKREIIDRRKARKQEAAGQPQRPDPIVEAKAKNLDADTEYKMARAYKTVSEAAGVAGTAQPLMSPAPAPPPEQFPPADMTPPANPLASPPPVQPGF